MWQLRQNLLQVPNGTIAMNKNTYKQGYFQKVHIDAVPLIL